MRHILTSIPTLRIRTTIRPTTWTVIYDAVEEISKVDQYLLPLNWTSQDIRNILSRRVYSYLKRTHQISENRPTSNRRVQEEEAIALLFGEEWRWGDMKQGHRGYQKPHEVLSTLCRDRPRWLIELCREAAKVADRKQSAVIRVSDVSECLETFGRKRIRNTATEFEPECAKISTIIEAFSDQKESYRTDELLKLIENRITNLVDVRISGEVGRCGPQQVAHFLFRIAFITARKEDESGFKHFSFSQRPMLLKNPSNLDYGCSWEIHPVFRQALRIRDNEGRQINRGSGKERK